MNLKAYISSGIIESYVLGMLSEAEQREFESMNDQYPEVEKAKSNFELSLERTLLQDAAAPPAALKLKIRDALFSDSPAFIPFKDDTETQYLPIRRINTWKWVAAASIVLLAGSLIWGYSVNNKYRELKGVAEENQSLRQQLDEAATSLAQVKNEATTLQKPDVKMAALKGTPVSPSSYVTVYWDTTTKDVYLMVNNLPMPASDRQYQLWALINNQSIDLGVLQMNQEKLIPMVKMKNVQNAQAFAITLEPSGGSPSPTMNQMYVVGRL